MTARSPATVLELMELNPQLTVYQYVQPGTQQRLYAVFDRQTEADLEGTSTARMILLLCHQGQMTTAGRAWVTEHGRKG